MHNNLLSVHYPLYTCIARSHLIEVRRREASAGLRRGDGAEKTVRAERGHRLVTVRP